MAKTSSKMEGTKKLMAALVGMKPKPHDALVAKSKKKTAKSKKKK